jgi:LmbE family N-acetylglucosaminyl deacetylase
MKKNILVVAAHPDDEVLGCGATIARYAREGHIVSVMILGEGVTSRDDKRQKLKRAKELNLLKGHVQKANSLLGVKSIILHDLPDNRFDTIDLLTIVKLIEKQLVKTEPEIVYTHTNCDLNIDHIITHRAVLTATRPQSGNFVKEIYAFEIPSSTEWAFQRFEPTFCPNTFIDIKDTLTLKIRAMNIYKSESKPFPHPRSKEALIALARYRGSAAGLAAAEAFELVRKIR